MKKISSSKSNIIKLTLFLLCISFFTLVSTTAKAHNHFVHATETFPVGVYEDLNLYTGPSSEADFLAFAADVESMGFDSIMFTNGSLSGNQDVIDVLQDVNLNIVWSSMGNFNGPFFYDNDVENTPENALALAQPITDAISSKENVIAYNLIDDSTRQQSDKIQTMVEAFRTLDPTRPALPTLTNFPNLEAVYEKSDPEIAFSYRYPVGYNSELCSLHREDFNSYITDLRNLKQAIDPDKPIWTVLQMHSTGVTPTSLRVPNMAELELQQWLAIGEGVKGIFWFIYSTQDPWLGIEDQPEIATKISSLANRLNSFKAEIINAQKIPDVFDVLSESNSYISTLYDEDTDTYYAVVSNYSCDADDFTIDSIRLDGELENLENGNTLDLGTTIHLQAGEGRVYKLINRSDIADTTPEPNTNMFINPGFELNGGGGTILWPNVAGIPEMFVDTDEYYSAIRSIRMEGDPDGTGDRYTGSSISLQPNSFYTMSYRSKINEDLDNIFNGIRLSILTPAVTIIQAGRVLVDEDQEWKYVTHSFRTPSYPVTARLDVRWFLEPGEVSWIDDVTFCQGLDDTCQYPWPNMQGTAEVRDFMGDLEIDLDTNSISGWVYNPNNPSTALDYRIEITNADDEVVYTFSGTPDSPSDFVVNNFDEQYGNHAVNSSFEDLSFGDYTFSIFASLSGEDNFQQIFSNSFSLTEEIEEVEESTEIPTLANTGENSYVYIGIYFLFGMCLLVYRFKLLSLFFSHKLRI